MPEFKYRYASDRDIPFLVNTIIEAEKSGTNILTYSTIFGLTEKMARKYLANMLKEGVDGCELSVSSFLLAETDNQTVAAVAAWIEESDGMSSNVLKGNLLNHALPRKCLERARLLNSYVRELHIDYIPDSIQIGLVYVSQAYRGHNLANFLINEHIRNLQQKIKKINGIYIQVFGNNKSAIKAYEKASFKKILTRESSRTDILNYMPSDKKILMKREITNSIF